MFFIKVLMFIVIPSCISFFGVVAIKNHLREKRDHELEIEKEKTKQFENL